MNGAYTGACRTNFLVGTEDVQASCCRYWETIDIYINDCCILGYAVFENTAVKCTNCAVNGGGGLLHAPFVRIYS